MVTTELHTIGYEAHDSETFVWLLQKAGVRLVVDVRWSARSRNRDFAKSALEEALTRAGIGYVHMPELGVAPELRAGLKQTGDFDAYGKEYLKHLSTRRDVLRGLYTLIAKEPCCLMCMEKDPRRCHRSVLADHLRRLNGDSISIRHL